MENNLPVLSKRVWSIVRVAFFMLRKGLTKPKLLMHLNVMLKCPGKLAGKAIVDLISHNRHHSHHGTSTATSQNAHLQFTTAREYEFSCSNTPKYSFFSKHRHIPRHFFACAHAPLTLDDETAAVNNALKVALEMLDDKKCKDMAVEEDPTLPASGRTQMVRPVRVTDSPFPVQDCDGIGDHQVDKAADEFIERFFNELRKQG
ncbi:hypothetical protein QN277_022498 [Acacia crassicarpa]|uniref:Avr9/Cf-9 rapidly elicited protein n=1 Tax=Acacia crassicarpa TaxID=499986 RepID=A0AAE1JIQ0_9FABA|nr:hypothetical protein QN277_022498 [Acacia crassicarpa]